MQRSLGHALLMSAAMVAAGCGSDGFVPPPPPELASASSADAIAPSKVVELILAATDHYEETKWVEFARSEVGEHKAAFHDGGIASSDPPRRQAELIRQAAERGAAGLIVEPADAPEVAQALQEVQAKGIPVVLIDRPAPSALRVEKPIPSVRYESPAESAPRLVEAAVDQLRAAGGLEGASAAILADSHGDARTPERVDAFRAALKAAGIARVEVVAFEGSEGLAAKALHTARDADPKIRLVVATDEPGVIGAVNAHADAGDPRAYVIAGYMALVTEQNLFRVNRCAAVVDRKTQDLVRKAVQAVFDQMDGKDVPATIEARLVFKPIKN